MVDAQPGATPKYLALQTDRSHFVQDLAERFPEIADGFGKLAIDLGCGSTDTPGDTHTQLAEFGYEWVGVDIVPGRATVVADGHALPFRDGTFALIVSIAALEHMRRPWVAMRELGRVARRGALFIGTTAFLEAEHGPSCFHMTHCGVTSLLDEGGFDVLALWPGWPAWDAVAWFTCIEGGGKKRLMYRPVRSLGRCLGVSMELIRHRRLHTLDDLSIDRLRFAGAVGFVAVKR